jgi:hypothetical protein
MILVEIPKDARAARRWCREHFGDIPLKSIPQWRRNYPLVYDRKTAKWLHWIGDYPYKFYFREEADAMFFKLIWG